MPTNSRCHSSLFLTLLDRNYFLARDDPEAFWLAHTLKHMAKMLPFVSHNMSLQNLQLVLQLSKAVPQDASVLPAEFVETLRARMKGAGMDAIDIDEISERMSRAGIQLSAEDRELIGF